MGHGAARESLDGEAGEPRGGEQQLVADKVGVVRVGGKELGAVLGKLRLRLGGVWHRVDQCVELLALVQHAREFVDVVRASVDEHAWPEHALVDQVEERANAQQAEVVRGMVGVVGEVVGKDDVGMEGGREGICKREKGGAREGREVACREGERRVGAA